MTIHPRPTARRATALALGAVLALGACGGGRDDAARDVAAARVDESLASLELAASSTSAPPSTTVAPSTTSSTTVAPSTTAAPSTSAAAAPVPEPAPAPPPATEPPAPPPPPPPPPAPVTTSPPRTTSLGPCPLFPANNYWHADVRALPRHARSDAYVAAIGATAKLKADFGSGLWDGGPIGIPYVVVPGTQPKVPVTFDYADESDPGPYPIPVDAPVEGGAASSGDRHVLVVDTGTCRLYETWSSYPAGAGAWRAGSGAVFDLRSNALRPATWTSADAAGLPILPGLVRYDEVAAGRIDHAIRITVPRTQRSYVWPARHQAGSTTDPNTPPMGTWLRLKADTDLSGFGHDARVILEALKVHGAIVADNGSAWYISGAPDERWDNDVLATLRRIPGSAFEAVDASGLMASPDSGQVR